MRPGSGFFGMQNFLRILWKNSVGNNLHYSMSNQTLPSRYLFKVIWSKLTIKTPERPYWRRSGVFVVNFEQNLHIFRVFNCWLRTSKCRLGHKYSLKDALFLANFTRKHPLRNIFLVTMQTSSPKKSHREYFPLNFHMKFLRQNIKCNKLV